MKVLIVSQYFWPENFRINDVAIGLKEKGYEVTVLTGQPNYPTGSFFSGYGFFKRSRENYCGVEVIRVPLLPRGNGSVWRLVLNYLSFAIVASLIGPFRCRARYDAIFVYAPSPITVAFPALMLKMLRSIPMTLWVLDLWPESLTATGVVRSEIIVSAVRRMVRFIYRSCDQVLVQSRTFFSPVQEFGVDLKKIRYFPNSAEALYKPISLPEDVIERKGMPKGFRVMFAGNIGAAQDFGTILSAAEKLRSYGDIHWLILGDGRMAPWVKQQIVTRKLESTVHLLGRHPVESMPRYFSFADAMLVTLKKEPIFALTVPAKVQSYLACSKPIIAALDGEGARIVKEANAGLTPPAENSGELAKAVLEMYRMTGEERQAMGKNGRQYFELNFERNMLLERLDGWLQDLN